ncbi:MAG TPA: outer membrane beta-barrel protein, partial [Segetibacter sp.]
YSESSNRNTMYRERTQVITADTSFFTRTSSLSDYKSNSHRANVNAGWFIDSSSTLDLTLSVALSQNNGRGSSSSTMLENGSLRNQSLNSSTSTGSQQNANATVNWTKRLSRTGRSLMVSSRFNSSDQQSDSYTLSLNTYFKSNVPVNGDTLDRQQKTTGNNRSYSLNLNYIEPVTKQLNFTMQGYFDFNSGNSNRELYNLDSASHTAEFDSLYSAKVFTSTNSQSLNASLAYNNKKWNVSAGVNTIFQQAIRTLQNEQLRQDLLRYSPSVNASLYLSKEKSLRLNFSANTTQPTMEQLQPVPDNSNPLYVRVGNPNLKTSFSQSYGLAYNFRNQKGKSLTANLGYSPTSNQIVNSIFYDEYRRQTSKYINVNGVYTMRGNVSFSNSAHEDKKTKTWSASSGANYGQQVYFQAGQLYYSRNYSSNINLSFSKREMVVRAATYTVSLTSSYGRNWTPMDTKILNTTRLSCSPQINGSCTLLDFIYVNASYQVWYNKINYHSSLRRVDEYSLHQLNSNFNFRIRKRFSVQGQVAYQYNTSVPDGSNNGTLNNTISATAQAFKGRGQLNFAAQDLFGRNQNLRRAIGENYIEDVQIDNLRNYFIVKLQYNFNKLEKRKEPLKK